MTILGWYAVTAALIFALRLDDDGPESAALTAVAWPLFALLFVALTVVVLAFFLVDAWRGFWRQP